MSSRAGPRFLIVVLGALILVVGAVPATTAFRSLLPSDAVASTADLADPKFQPQLDRDHHAQFECMRAELAEQIPPGSTVYAAVVPDGPEPDLWQQRLNEMVFPLATIVGAAGPGVLTISAIADPRGPESADSCTGVLLVVDQG